MAGKFGIWPVGEFQNRRGTLQYPDVSDSPQSLLLACSVASFTIQRSWESWVIAVGAVMAIVWVVTQLSQKGIDG